MTELIVALLVAERVFFYWIVFTTKEDDGGCEYCGRKEKTKRRSPVKKAR